MSTTLTQTGVLMKHNILFEIFAMQDVLGGIGLRWQDSIKRVMKL